MRNCSGERIACHSSSDLWSEPGAAMATTPPRKPRLGRREGDAEMERVGGAMGFASEKDEGGEERRSLEKMGLEQIGVGVVLRTVKLMAMLLCSHVTFTFYIIVIYSPFSCILES